MKNTHTPTPAGIHSIVHRYPNHTKKSAISSPKYSRMSSMGCACINSGERCRGGMKESSEWLLCPRTTVAHASVSC